MPPSSERGVTSKENMKIKEGQNQEENVRIKRTYD
jgi:hypothetical protein